MTVCFTSSPTAVTNQAAGSWPAARITARRPPGELAGEIPPTSGTSNPQASLLHRPRNPNLQRQHHPSLRAASNPPSFSPSYRRFPSLAKCPLPFGLRLCAVDQPGVSKHAPPFKPAPPCSLLPSNGQSWWGGGGSLSVPLAKPSAARRRWLFGAGGSGTSLRSAAGRHPKKTTPLRARRQPASARDGFTSVASPWLRRLRAVTPFAQSLSPAAGQQRIGLPGEFWCGGVVVVSVVRPSVQACRCLAGRQAWFTPDRLCRVVWSAAGKQLPARLAVVVVCRGGGPGPRSWLVRSARTGWLFTTTSRCINLNGR